MDALAPKLHSHQRRLSRWCNVMLSAVTLALTSLLAGVPFSASAAPSENRGLVPFGSDEELREYLHAMTKERHAKWQGGVNVEEVAVTGVRVTESITNSQTAGVDEGGIVKVHGNHLIILRRGRLFTVSIDDGQLRPSSWANAFAPGIDPGSTWYDEMIVHGDRVIVIGYSYERDGTEIGLFEIDALGRLRYEATYHLRSNDYYSSRNYASRLAGSKLIFYTPLYLSDMDSLPAMRRWPEFRPARVADDGFTQITSPAKIFRPARPLHAGEPPVLHTVTTCDLSTAAFSCEATGVIGSSSEVFYVSSSAVYVWTDGGGYSGNSDKQRTSIAYRLPLDGSLPSAIAAFGNPIDQFSFLEADGHLNVLVGADSTGNAMWNAEAPPGGIALLRVPLSAFGGGLAPQALSQYRSLPSLENGHGFQNRFIGNRLLYGAGSEWNSDKGEISYLHVVDIRSGQKSAVPIPHTVDRIESLGTDGIAIGTDATEALHFTGIDLGHTPRSKQHYAISNTAQGELRSHGFFYAADGANRGMLGLPVRGGGEAGWSHLKENSAAIVFLRNDGSDFVELGLLHGDADDIDDSDDGCTTSCVDWYGNARPIFLRGRVYALLGYELVEGRVRAGKLQEARRIDFAPFVSFDR